MSEGHEQHGEEQAQGGSFPPTDPGAIGGESAVDPMIRTLLLVSAISNAVFALLNLVATLALCYTFVLAIPMVVLCVFEFMLWSQLSKPGDHRDKASKLQVLAICEICTILACNVPSLVCGIMQLTNKNKLDAAPSSTPAAG